MPFHMTADAIVKVDAKKEPIFPTLSNDMRDNQSNAWLAVPQTIAIFIKSKWRTNPTIFSKI